ncbi:hypothetical protein RIF29_33257 [Crotalaria pallida]|uniref:Uncharacterized protein n=1 Tax=Crotalaria pallida TaxID=3830 RepID=A0AAN9E851_CROPI
MRVVLSMTEAISGLNRHRRLLLAAHLFLVSTVEMMIAIKTATLGALQFVNRHRHRCRGTVSADEINITRIVEKNEEDALHGDWLIVQKRRKGGREKIKGLVSDKGKGISSQSLTAKNNKHVGTSVRDLGNIPHMQSTTTKDVQLTTELSRVDVASLSPPGTNSLAHENSTVSTSGKDKGRPMKGFDLGTEIIISPGLLGGSKTQIKKGSGLGEKPPDHSWVTGQHNSHAGNVSSHAVGMNEVVMVDGLLNNSLGGGSKATVSGS